MHSHPHRNSISLLLTKQTRNPQLAAYIAGVQWPYPHQNACQIPLTPIQTTSGITTQSYWEHFKANLFFKMSPAGPPWSKHTVLQDIDETAID